MVKITHVVPDIHALSMGKKTPSRLYAKWSIVNMPKEDRATDTGNMHKKFGKDRACGSGDICIVIGGKKTSSRRYAMRPIVNVLDEDRATDKGNMHKKFGKDRASDSGDILADRQTSDRHTHHNTSQPLPRAK